MLSLGAWSMGAWMLLETVPTRAGLDPSVRIFCYLIIWMFLKAGRYFLCLYLLF
jgi:hypothetical protein